MILFHRVYEDSYYILSHMHNVFLSGRSFPLILMRSRPTHGGAIYFAEKIIRYNIFQNKGKCLYFNTPYH